MNKFNPDDFKMGYFLIYKNTGGIFGNLICKKQQQAGFTDEESRYVHVEVSLGGVHSINVSPPKSRLIDITKVHKGRYIKLVKYKEYGSDNKRYKVAVFAASLNNLGYDIWGIASFLFRFIKQNNRLYFCSESAAESLQRVYPKAFNKPPSEIYPADFCQFETVWEGCIK